MTNAIRLCRTVAHSLKYEARDIRKASAALLPLGIVVASTPQASAALAQQIGAEEAALRYIDSHRMRVDYWLTGNVGSATGDAANTGRHESEQSMALAGSR